MNVPPGQQDDDEMARAMKRGNKKPLFVGLAIVVGCIALFGLHVARGFSATRAELEKEGYTDVAVKLSLPFSFQYTGKKGTAECSGTIERLPFSSSTQESCFGVRPSTPTPPKRPEAEVLAEGLKKRFAEIGVVSVDCRPIEPAATTATCKMASAGDPIEIVLGKDGTEWTVQKPERVIDRKKLSANIAASLLEKNKLTIEVDCGAGLFGYGTGDKLSCAAARPGAKTPGKVDVSFEAAGKYSWEGSGF